jgi:FlaA1/EpsC-like NDP-sugar epimerase
MTVREACDLVVMAACHALTTSRPDVSVYVLNMGQPVRILDLAERMIRLSGLEPGRDVEIAFTGLRPGERLEEVLFTQEEPTVDIGIAGIVAATPFRPLPSEITRWLTRLQEAISDYAKVEEVLREAVPDFRPRGHVERQVLGLTRAAG